MRGPATFADVLAKTAGVSHATHVVFSVCGTGVPWNVGYPWDLCAALDDTFWVQQPIGYPAGAFPMKPSYTAGVTEFVRQLYLWGCDRGQTWGAVGYSQGAIVFMIVLMRVLFGDLQQFKATFIGGVTFGNPMREAGHTLPGGIDPGGMGIVEPNAHDTPDSVWDFACGSKMVNAPGNDLYATAGAGENALALEDQRAIWDIVDNEKVSSLAKAIAKLLLLPSWNGTIGAAQAAFGAMGFFIIHAITAHTSYQFVQPIAGDDRDCWRVGLDHMNQLGRDTPASEAIAA